ncbi:MAG: molecular chaperone DnaJ [Planctomycetia bacterium]|nr:molecular chaperone DnaJ [Planctomycetia bacterium]
MSQKRDYYEVLGITRTATDAEISSAYRKLAKRHHPDRNPGDPEAVERFKEVTEAFEVLRDPQKRQQYDRFGHSAFENGAGGGGTPFHNAEDIFNAFFGGGGDGGGFGGIFGNIFGGGGNSRPRGPQPGDDVRCDVTLTLQEAARGVRRTIEIERNELCSRCKGTGAKEGFRRETCTYCNGTGRIVQSQGFFSIQQTCPACHGEGSAVPERNRCTHCGGSGLEMRRVEREVTIPAGVDSGVKLRMSGEGEPSRNGGPRGDAYCFIRVRPDPIFRREGQHLLLILPVSYSQAALGAEIEIPTLDGKQNLTIPAGTQYGDQIRLRGRGIPNLRGRGVGDLVVQVIIEVPKRLSAEHRKVLRELAEIEKSHVSPERRSFFQKLRDYFVEPEKSEIEEKSGAKTATKAEPEPAESPSDQREL